jgi:glycosyltransferase involved in cell wall biosynthesis
VLQIVDCLRMGGTERQLAALLSSLDPGRVASTVACFHRVGAMVPVLEGLGVPVAELPLKGSLKQPNTLLQIARLVRLGGRAGARMVHSHDFYSNLVAAVAAPLIGVPLVVSRRDLGNWLSPGQRRTLGFVTRRAHRVVCNAEAIARQVAADDAVDPARLRVIPNGIDLARFDRERAHPLLPLPPRRPGVPRVAMLASMNLPDKGQGDLIDAAARLQRAGRRVEWLLIGDGVLRGALEAVCATAGLGETVLFLGHRDDAAAILDQVDLAVHASWAEGLSNAVLEAMCAARPVVATRVGHARAGGRRRDRAAGPAPPPGPVGDRRRPPALRAGPGARDGTAGPPARRGALLRGADGRGDGGALRRAGDPAAGDGAPPPGAALPRRRSARGVMKRALLVGPRPPPEGGVASHVRALAALLTASGYRVARVDPHRSPGGGRGAWLLALMEAHARGQIVHAHTHGHGRSGWLLALACAGPRSILTVHSGLAPAYLREHPRLARAALAGYAEVVAVSAPIAEALLELGLPPTRLTVCTPFLGGDGLRLPPPGLALIRRAHAPLFACALGDGPEYGARVLPGALARVADRLPGCGAVLFGAGARSDALAGELTARRLDDRVARYGALDHARALAVIAAADIFIRPTLADGDSISVREALALGKQVVASDASPRPRGVATYQAADPASLAELLFQTVGTAVSPVRDDGAKAAAHLVELYERVRGVTRK